MTNTFDYKAFLQEVYDKPAKLHQAYHAFHNYSLGNCMLAMMQLGEPQPINTFKGWQALGRHVKKGEKAIELLMPVTCKKEVEGDNGETEEKSFTRFVARKNWFGMSQTEGEPVHFDNVPGFSLQKALTELGIEQVPFQHTDGNCMGYALPTQKKIAINPVAFAPFKTAIHEAAHCLLHGDVPEFSDSDKPAQAEKEFEAEATAYLVSCALGKYENLESSRGYISTWINRDDVSEKLFSRAFQAANKILTAGKLQEQSLSR